MSTTTRVRIKVNTEGDFIYGQEFAAPPINIGAPVVEVINLDTPAVEVFCSCENYFILIPPEDNEETIFIRGSQLDTPIGLMPNIVSSIAIQSISVWLSASGPVTIRYMLL